MKTNWIFLRCVYSIVLFCPFLLSAQRNTVSAGAEATGSGGTLSYSIGQIDFISSENANGQVQQGLQQAYRLTLDLSCFIEGYYIGAGQMSPVLFNQGQVNGLNDADTVTVQLKQTTSPYATIDSYRGVLQTNGIIQCLFPLAAEGQAYYVVIKHRNALETWSANPVVLGNSGVYSFSSSATQAYGNNLVQVDNGVWALYSGDINGDENIDLVDGFLLETDINNFEFGYMNTDINGDGNVDLVDNPSLEANINAFIYSLHP